MDRGLALANVGWAVGDPSRAAMLTALMSGQALTAGELAAEAGVAASTASSHLAILSERGFVEAVRQGRHRYFRLAGAEVAAMLERLSTFAGSDLRPLPRGAAPAALRQARTCYDHLAGELGVRAFDAMIADRRLVAAAGGVSLSGDGRAFLTELGVAVREMDVLDCRPCLDFTERRPHLGGRAAAALLTAMTDRRWLAPGPVRRSLRLTLAGRAAFDRHFRLAV